jgi:transposase
MNTLHQHYRLLLGLDDTWDVADVQLDLKANRVSIALAHRPGVRVACPECGASCTVYDHNEQRTWRHLDTMQFETLLTARLPRADCKKCGPKQTPRSRPGTVATPGANTVASASAASPASRVTTKRPSPDGVRFPQRRVLNDRP